QTQGQRPNRPSIGREVGRNWRTRLSHRDPPAVALDLLSNGRDSSGASLSAVFVDPERVRGRHAESGGGRFRPRTAGVGDDADDGGFWRRGQYSWMTLRLDARQTGAFSRRSRQPQGARRRGPG